jgi:hypothetical protein
MMQETQPLQLVLSGGKLWAYPHSKFRREDSQRRIAMP